MASPDPRWLINIGDPLPGEPGNHRRARVIGPPDTFGDDFPFVIVYPLTTTRRGLSLHVQVDPHESSGLDHISYVQCALLRSINRRRLVHQLGTVDTVTSSHVDRIRRALLGH